MSLNQQTKEKVSIDGLKSITLIGKVNDMDVRSLLLSMLILFEACKHRRSRSNQTIQYYSKLRDELEILFGKKPKNILVDRGHQDLFRIIRNIAAHSNYHLSNDENMENDTQWKELKKNLPRYHERLKKVDDNDLIIWNIDANQQNQGKPRVTFCCIIDYDIFRNILLKILKARLIKPKSNRI